MDTKDLTREVGVHLDAIAALVRERPVGVSQLRAQVESLLVFLSSPAGRTDRNCQVVDSTLMRDDELWDAVEEIESADLALADVLRDMAGALHDTVSAPQVAANFDSTPEQLLSRLRSGRSA
jgi:hypothetical protein